MPPVIEIDFSLALHDIPRISYTDVLYGRVDPARLADKQVIVGAGAIELRDFFQVPLHGIVSGPLVQALALETLKSGRMLVNWGPIPGLVLTALGALVMLLTRRSGTAVTGTALLACIPITEAAARTSTKA